MYLGYQQGKIKFYTEKPLNKEVYNLDRVEETQDEYVLEGDEYILKDEEYIAQQLEKAKEEKKAEALSKAYDFQANGYVEYKNARFELSDSNRKNLSDTQEALEKQGLSDTPWNDKDDNIIILTLDDIQYIRLNLILGSIQKLWLEDYPKYLAEISVAKTVEEVEGIEIEYG